MLTSWGSRLLKVISNQFIDSNVRHLHRLEVTGQGHSYRTQIIRKRPVRDANQPLSLDWSQPESLKYTDWPMFKDLKRRHLVSLNYPTRISLLTMFRSPLLPQALRDQALHDLRFNLPKTSTWARLVNRCVITSRKRGRIQKYWVSRFIFRQNADHNRLSGVIKSKWGP